MVKRAVLCLILAVTGSAWAQQEDSDSRTDSPVDSRQEYRSRLLETCLGQSQEFTNLFVSAGLKKPTRAMQISYCNCVGDQVLKLFSDEDLDALLRENKGMDDDDIDFKLGQIVNACVIPLLSVPR